MTDQLTGLYNRHSLSHLLPKYFNSTSGHTTPLSLMVLDIDHFKHINDTYGHTRGNDVLKKFGQLISSSFRSEDLVARYGGEEFVVLMAHAPIEHALEKAEELRKYIESHLIEGLKITISIGIASADSHADFEALFNQADSALYNAKNSGRNQTIIYPVNSIAV